jgi:DNA-directed RNA polymerase subunit RPC12/RpoP
MNKKLWISGVLLSGLACLLSSCTVNWFDKQYDVAWWAIAVPVALLAVILFVAARLSFTGKTYVCPACSREFSPPWWKIPLAVHINSDRVLKCPHCGARSFCRLVRRPKD